MLFFDVPQLEGDPEIMAHSSPPVLLTCFQPPFYIRMPVLHDFRATIDSVVHMHMCEGRRKCGVEGCLSSLIPSEQVRSIGLLSLMSVQICFS